MCCYKPSKSRKLSRIEQGHFLSGLQGGGKEATGSIRCWHLIPTQPPACRGHRDAPCQLRRPRQMPGAVAQSQGRGSLPIGPLNGSTSPALVIKTKF